MRDLMIELMNQGLKGRSLPAMRFFKPTTRFLKRVFDAHMPVIDVGAGCGQLAAALMRKQIKVLAIDICDRDETDFHVYVTNACEFKYPTGCLPIIARPCHGPWLEMAIEKAMETGDNLLTRRAVFQ